MNQTSISGIALLGGCLLGFMVFLNGILVKYLGPIQGSFLVHIIGLLASILILYFKTKTIKFSLTKYKFEFVHCVGLFGGISVALIGYTVNTPLGIAGTVGAVVLGQLFYGWANDFFGFFGSPKKKLNLFDVLQALFILLGVGVIVYG